MSITRMKYLRTYRAPADEGADLGGAPAPTEDENLDLGDVFTPPTKEGEKDAPAIETPKTTEEEVAAAKKEAGFEEDQPRTPDGKFAKKDKPDAVMIPKGRVDEMVAKEREAKEIAERRLAELEQARQQTSKQADITAQLAKMEEQVATLRASEHEALYNDDKAKAKEFAKERDALNRAMIKLELQAQTTNVSAQAVEEIRLDMTITNLKETYSVLDENSEDYDQDIVDDVLDKRNGLIERERLSPAAALAKAAKIVMKRYAPKDDAPATTGLAKSPQVADRKAAAVAKNVDAANRQPPSTKESGLDSDKAGMKGLPDITKMTAEEFEALPAATKARMMGDVL